jgi:hypothetical protein
VAIVVRNDISPTCTGLALSTIFPIIAITTAFRTLGNRAVRAIEFSIMRPPLITLHERVGLATILVASTACALDPITLLTMRVQGVAVIDRRPAIPTDMPVELSIASAADTKIELNIVDGTDIR